MSASDHIGFQALFERLSPRVTVVTATRRLARSVLHAYGRHREERGDAVWERPDVLAWEGWLTRCWEDARLRHDLPALVDTLQAQLWWEDIVAADAGDELLRPDGAAQQAMTAWEALCQWQLPRDRIRRGSEAGARFLRWAERFEARSRRAGVIDPPRLATAALERAADVFRPGAPHSLVLIGFDRITPAQGALLDGLRALGWEVLRAAPDARGGRVARRAYPDADAEVRGFCDWARQTLLDRPEASIGLIVRDLAQRRSGLERLLTEGLAPGLAAPWLETGEPPWNISLGQPLANTPIAADALMMLDLLAGRADLATWGRLLHSPFLAGSEDERLARAQLDVALRESGDLSLTRGEVHEVASSLVPSPRILVRWLAAIPEPSELGPRPPSQWAAVFADVLEAAGWPGPRTPDSAEHQAVGAFNEMLSRFAALDHARPRLELRPALALLHRVAGQQVFQPAGNDAAPVQVMGVLEVPGMAFDALWVLGADDGHWPAPLQPAPFIPVALQRAHGMPEADPAAALALDRDLAARLNRAADCVVWSWPRQAGEEQLRASPLLNGLIDDVEDEPANPRWPELVQRVAPAPELVIDRYGDMLPEGSRMPGGTGFLRHQAACPFQGYVLHRLDAWPLEIGRFGPDPRDRGTLVHSVLEHLWGQLRTRQALDELDAPRRRRVVERSVEHALAEAERGGQRGRFTGRIAELERERLVELALDWLAVEERRDHFEVAGREVDGEIERGGLRFRVRLDRVDRLPDGTEVILDYKTGAVQVSALHGDERPDDLQLALYARHHAAPVAGVAWAVVRRGECGFTGLAREGDCLPGVRSAGRCLKLDDDADAWRTLHEAWDAALDTLIAEARQGDARVDPKPRACQRCPLPGLCRVGEDAGMDDAPA